MQILSVFVKILFQLLFFLVTSILSLPIFSWLVTLSQPLPVFSLLFYLAPPTSHLHFLYKKQLASQTLLIISMFGSLSVFLSVTEPVSCFRISGLV